MRILHIDTGEEMQGGQWQVLYLMRGLRERGIEQSLSGRRGELATRAYEEGFDIEPRGPFDLMHAHDAQAHTLAAIRSGKSLVVSRRVAFPVRSGLLSRLKYRRALHYIAISQHVAGTLIDAGLKPESISVVYDGVPIPEFRKAPDGGGVFGLAKQSTEELLLEAARRAGITVQIVKNLEEDLKRASALVYLSKVEGLGSGALLAMAAGVPLIASRVGGLSEVVEQERTGLLVDNDADEIAAAMKRLASDPELARRLARQAYLRASERFSVATMVQGTIEVYERLLR